MRKPKLLYSTIAIILILSVECKFESGEKEKKNTSDTQVEKFVIEPDISYQTIDNFGASDAWSMQYIGLWPEKKQQQMATWLFSTENDEQGNPKGIGLSLWRFNIGAGSKEQGRESKIDNPWRRAECFLLPDGTYDWKKQKGQRNFMQLAKKQGVEQFLGFIYSPPVYFTHNGLATNLGRGGTLNIKKDKLDDFAGFIADVIQGIEENEGIRFNYISPFNEPDGHWNWDGNGQEGTAATKYEIAETVRLIGGQFKNRNIATKIIVPESSDYHCMFSTHQFTKADRGYQIQSYFTPDSAESYIGNVYNVPHLVAGHSYWTNTPLSSLRKIRMEMGAVLKNYDVHFWQTELCVMSNDTEIGGGRGKDLSMRTALYIARVIHHDMVYANASAWQWWRAVANGDYKDGLIYTNTDTNNIDGTFTDSKLMWALGNYSRFIRPGATRIGVSALDNSGNLIQEGDTDPYAIMISAYKNDDNSLVVVIINYSNENRQLNLELKGSSIEQWVPYITSDSQGFNLKKQVSVPYGDIIQIPARSVVTLVSLKSSNK